MVLVVLVLRPLFWSSASCGGGVVCGTDCLLLAVPLCAYGASEKEAAFVLVCVCASRPELALSQFRGRIWGSSCPLLPLLTHTSVDSVASRPTNSVSLLVRQALERILMISSFTFT